VPFHLLGWYRQKHNQISANSVVIGVACRRGANAAQVALAWLLARAPYVSLTAGTTNRIHLRETLAASELSLGDDEVAQLGAQIRVTLRRVWMIQNL
jgi:aryl-alcohol dehydrogenase-like predicted oxidoreductase